MKKKKAKIKKRKKININEELANIIISTGCFDKDSLLIGKGEADVIIKDNDGNEWDFEIKQSSWPKGKFFDAATLTQWYTWYKNQERYYFVFITGKKKDRRFTFVKASDLMARSTIPPFKIYFNVYKDEVYDNYVNAVKFQQQIQDLVSNKDSYSLPSMKQHTQKRKTTKQQDGNDQAIQLANISIEKLQYNYDSLKKIQLKKGDM